MGTDQHIEVANFKEIKENEWEIVKGLINSTTGLTNIKAAKEVTDDLSGDRFIILQDGTGLKKIDYDATNSPLTGYENETPDPLSLPSGVTIGADDTCRFFVNNGIVRITGGSEPMWYGYIDETFFPNSWSTLDLDDFNSGVDGWAGSGANVSQETVSPLLEGAGTLEIESAVATGYAYKAFSVTSGKKYSFFIKGIKASGQNSTTTRVLIGTTQGGNEIASIIKDTVDEWIVFEQEFTATSSTIYISITAHAMSDIVHFDYSLLRENHEIIIEDWYLYKAQLPKPTNTEIAGVDVRAHGTSINAGGFLNCIGAVGLGYDKSQYGMLREDQVFTDGGGFNVFTDYVNAICSGSYGVVEFDPKIDGSLTDYRITSILLAMFYQLGEAGIIDKAVGEYKVYEEIDFTEEYEDGWIFAKANFHNLSANHKRLNLWQVGDDDQRWWDGLFQVGRRIRIANATGTLDTVITNYNEATSNDQNHYIEVLDDCDALGAYDTDLSQCGVWIERVWDYSGGNYQMRVAAEIEGTNLGTFPAFADIPSGTEENIPDYTHHLVIENTAFILSNEDEEQDIIRFSPSSQYDNFPEGNVIQTPVGDIDRNLALVERDGRFVTLKRKSVAQGQFTSNSYYHDKDGVAHGLYATYGYIIIDDVLYFMDIDDIYMFNGVQVQPFMQNSLMRSLYVANVHTESFFAYKPLDKELWLVLNGIIIVYDFERRNFYLRETAITPVRGFTDYDQRLFLYSSTKFTLYDHSQTTFDESMQASFKTRIVDLKSPQHLKHLKKIYIRMISNTNYAIDFTDEKESAPYESDAQTPPTSKFTLNTLKPKYLFREGYLEFQTAGIPSNLTGTIKTIDLVVQRWKSEP
jgi:hypothetical protein